MDAAGRTDRAFRLGLEVPRLDLLPLRGQPIPFRRRYRHVATSSSPHRSWFPVCPADRLVRAAGTQRGPGSANRPTAAVDERRRQVPPHSLSGLHIVEVVAEQGSKPARAAQRQCMQVAERGEPAIGPKCSPDLCDDPTLDLVPDQRPGQPADHGSPLQCLGRARRPPERRRRVRLPRVAGRARPCSEQRLASPSAGAARQLRTPGSPATPSRIRRAGGGIGDRAPTQPGPRVLEPPARRSHRSPPAPCRAARARSRSRGS